MCLAQTEPETRNLSYSLASQAQELGENISNKFIPVSTDRTVEYNLIGGLRKLKEQLR